MDKLYHSLKYKFIFRNGEETVFHVELDKDSLKLNNEINENLPSWTELSFCRCPNCPLDEKIKNCPIAENMYDLIEFFKASPSYEEADVVIEGDEREYMKHTTLQKAISSLIGVYMVTSGCPIMEKFKPLVRFHLPFASLEETTFRIISMYLTAQYYRKEKGLEHDWTLKGLVDIYSEIQVVNKNFSKRLKQIEVEDASINAIVILSSFANYVSFSILEDMLEDIKPVYDFYNS